MTRRKATGLEQAIDLLAAIAFACCAAWSLFLWGAGPSFAFGGALAAGVAALVALRHVRVNGNGLGFDVVEAEFEEPVDDTLLLEDRLVEPAENSQVVRLFAVGGGGGAAAHAPGELASRIDTFLERGRAPFRAVPVQPDAAQELYEALADIRRTLR